MKKAVNQKKSLGKELISLAGWVMLAMAIAFPVRALLFEPIKVDGQSMRNTLQDGEVVIMTKPGVLLGN